jgi:hypothetical protein
MRRFALVLTVGLLALAFATTASANTTTTTFTTISDTFFDAAAAEVCGFPIFATINGSFKQTNYYDNSGSLVKSIITDFGGPFYVRITNPETGKYVTSQSAAIAEILTFNPDGSLASDTIAGIYINDIVPGLGTIRQRIGRVVFDGNGNLVFEAGQQDFTVQDAAAFCAYMADP